MAEPTPSAVPGHPTGPAVDFAEWLPALGGSRLLRVHGEASSSAAPALVLATPAGEHRVEPRAASRFTRAHEWRASYLIPAELVAAGWSETTLEWPGGTRLPIPDPPTEPRAEVVDPSVLATLRARRTATPPPATTQTERDPTSAPPAAAHPAPSSPEAAGPAPSSPAATDSTPPSAAATDSAPSSAAATDSAPSFPAAADLAPSSPAAADLAPSRAGADLAPSLPAAAAPAPSSPGVAVPPAPSADEGPRSWTDPPEVFSGSVFEVEAVWTAKRAELERELGRAAEAIGRAREGERAARDAVLAALANVRADLRAARAARAADESTIAALSAELEAERVAHAVTRRTAADLRTALAQARRHRAENDSAGTQLAGAVREAEGLRTALDAERTARTAAEDALRETRQEGSALMRRIAELNRAAESDDAALARRAREHAGTAAAAARRPQQETGELVANLEAAAATLRASRASAETLPEAETSRDVRDPGPLPAAASSGDSGGAAAARDAADPDPLPAAASSSRDSGDAARDTAALAEPPLLPGLRQDEPAPRPLRRVLVALAERDPVVAGEILVGLLGAQGPLFAEPVAYDLTVAGIGTFAVTVTDGVAAVERIARPRSRRNARFELRSDPLTLAELLAGEERRIGRFAGRARVSRRRRKARDVLQALPAARMSLVEAVRAGARLEPAHAYRALPLAIDPAWTAGHSFAVAQEIIDPDPRTWYLVVRDGAGLEVAESAPEQPVDASVTMTRAAFDRLLRDEPPAPGERPLVRGDRAAVALLKEWTDRARGAA